jgi:hypothetical protein
MDIFDAVGLDGKVIRTALNAARRQGLIPTNPAEAVELPECQLNRIFLWAFR